MNNRLRAAFLALTLTFGTIACGTDVILIVNTGTVIGDPICRDGTGEFDFRDTGGLLLVVLINTETQIFLAGGVRGTCSDIAADASVQVRGQRSGEAIAAQSVTVH